MGLWFVISIVCFVVVLFVVWLPCLVVGFFLVNFAMAACLGGCCGVGIFFVWMRAGCLVWWLVLFGFYGEFDPGSGRTLAACLTHASRTMMTGACFGWISGERVSNT